MGRREGQIVRLLGLAVLLAAGALCAAEPVDILAARNDIGPKVCLVTVDGPVGLPVAYATGFLLGEGKFVITDLASVAQPGVKQVTLRFRDGSTAVGSQFGMADPAIGLVAILLGSPKTDVGGLGLAPGPPADGTEAALVGWKRAQDLDVLKGTMRKGVSSADLATLVKIEPPNVSVTFLTFVGVRTDMATGAPAVDASGKAIGVLLDLAGVDRTILVPAALLRSSLLSAGAQLKPLTELPKPVWPVDLYTLAGKAVTPAEFAQAVRNAKSRSRCTDCGGKGVVMNKKLLRTERTPLGTTRAVYQEVQESCKTCKGEGVVCGDGLYSIFATMAYGAAWLAAAPDVDPKAREAALTNGATMLKALAKVGANYRNAFVAQSAADLAKPGDWPRGLVVYAMVRENVNGPDGAYTLLAPVRPPVLLAVKSVLLEPPPGADGKSGGARPAAGRWIVLGGAAEGAALIQGQKPILVRPFGWTPGPSLHGGMGPGPAFGPPDQLPPRKQPGDPDFFGL
jgi:hypothetical protein